MTRKRRSLPRSVALVLGAAATTVLLSAGSASSFPNALPQTYTIAYPYTPTNLDPAIGGGVLELQLALEPVELSGAANTLTPNLATSVSQPNPTTLVVHLRKNVKFSNGDPMTAEDVAWSIEHTLGAKSVIATYVPNYKSASVTGPYEVTVHLKAPALWTVGAMAFAAFVQDKKVALAAGKKYGTAAALPVGTGPYKITSFTTNGITLVRNENYWGPKPPIPTVKYVFLTNDNTGQLAIRSGSIQGYLFIQSLRTLSTWQRIPGVHTVKLVNSDGPVFLTMDVTRPPFNDIHVRRAIAYSVDRKGLIQAIYGGNAKPLKALFDEHGVASVAPSLGAARQFESSLPQYTFDLEKAKAELAKSRYPHGFKFTIPIWTGHPYSEFTALNLKQNLAKLGITVTLKPLSDGPFFAQQLSGKARGLQIVRFGASFPEDPIGGMLFMFGQANKNVLNYANFFSSATEKAWQQAAYGTAKSVRWQGAKALLRATATQLPYVPLYDEPLYTVLGGNITPSSPLEYTDMLNKRWVYELK